MMTSRERCLNDPVFRTLVDAIYNEIIKHNFTPSEIRDAAMVAAMKYEYSHVRTLWPELAKELCR